MTTTKLMQSVSPNGTTSSLISKIFDVYVRIVMVWVIGALIFDIYMIVKHFQEFGFN